MPRKLSIAFVVASFYPMIGGIELYVLNIAKELKKRGHEVHVYTPNRVMGRRLIPSEEDIDGIKVHRVHVIIELSYRIKLWPSLLRCLLKNDPDVIHVYSHDLYAILALTVAKIMRKPIIVTTYGPFSAQTECGPIKHFLFDMYDNMFTPLIFHLSDKVSARYSNIIPWIESFRTQRHKIGLEPSGIPKDCLRLRDGKSFREKYEINGPAVLYVGRISPQKGVQHLVKASYHVVQEISDVKFIFIGPDYTNYKAKLLKIACELRTDKNILFFRSIYDLEEEMKAYAACDVFVMPSSFEGFSQAIHKAWAQGKPVIATSVGFLSHQISNGRDGLLVKYGDHKALAEAIIRILRYPSLASAIGARGYEKARHRTYDILATRIETIYNEIIAEKLSE